MNEAEGNHKQPDHGSLLDTLSPDDVRERLWAYEDFAGARRNIQPFNVAGAFASLGFIGAAVRRSRGSGSPWRPSAWWRAWASSSCTRVSYQANVTVLVKNNPAEDPVSAMLTQVRLVESQSVASSAVKALGLTQSVSSFQAAYTATVVTNQVLSITANAPTSTARSIGPMKSRRSTSSSAPACSVPSRRRRRPRTRSRYPRPSSRSPHCRVGSASSQGQPSQQAELTKLQNQLKTATDTLPTLEQTVTGLTTAEESTTSAMIDGTQVLNAATAMHHSKIKDVIEYVALRPDRRVGDRARHRDRPRADLGPAPPP